MKGLAWRRLTLSEAVRHSMKFRFTGVQCGWTVIKSPLGLATLCNLPFDTRVHELAWRLACSKCGSREVTVVNEPDS